MSFQLSDRVPETNLYRQLKQTLDLQWIYKATKKYYGRQGQLSIDPVVFFRLLLVGYLENLASDRRIISTASMRLDVLYFIGYDIDEPLPWHSTLSRTRQLYGDEVFKKLFKQVLAQCCALGMVSGRRQAVDSAPVKANASMDSIALKEVMDDADVYVDELHENEAEHPQPKVSIARKKRVDQHHGYQAKAYKGMPAANRSNAKFLSNHTHYSTTDPDARISVKPGKPRQFNYHAQTVVDTAHHVITHIESSLADKKDSQCLAPVLAGVMENLEENDLKIKEILADGSYSSGEALKALEANGLTGYIPNFGQYKAVREGFTYDAVNDRYQCSQGIYLPFKKVSVSSLGYERRVYRSSGRDCKQCPLKESCAGNTSFKKIEDTVDKPLYDRMEARKRSDETHWLRMKKLRSATVEPVLGTLINYMGMKRINTRGIASANKCMLMAAVAYNLKKMLKWQRVNRNAAVMAMAKPKPASSAAANGSLHAHLCVLCTTPSPFSMN